MAIIKYPNRSTLVYPRYIEVEDSECVAFLGTNTHRLQKTLTNVGFIQTQSANEVISWGDTYVEYQVDNTGGTSDSILEFQYNYSQPIYRAEHSFWSIVKAYIVNSGVGYEGTKIEIIWNDNQGTTYGGIGEVLADGTWQETWFIGASNGYKSGWALEATTFACGYAIGGIYRTIVALPRGETMSVPIHTYAGIYGYSLSPPSASSNWTLTIRLTVPAGKQQTMRVDHIFTRWANHDILDWEYWSLPRGIYGMGGV